MALYKGNQLIENVYVGNQAISEIYYGSQLVYSSGVWLTVNPTPSNATVTFNTAGKVDGNRIRVKKGTIVSYTVSASGYYSKTENVIVNNDQSIAVVLETQYYQDGQTIFESSVDGTSTVLTIQTDGRYQVICVGGGGGGAATGSIAQGKYIAASGGSGSGFNLVFQLNPGGYPITVGSGGAGAGGPAGGLSTPNHTGTDGGNSSFGSSIAYAGKGGTSSASTYVGGAGGAAPTITYTTQTIYLNTAGVAGSAANNSNLQKGGTAVYGSYGAGGDAQAKSSNSIYNKGTDGYVKVIFLGK